MIYRQITQIEQITVLITHNYLSWELKLRSKSIIFTFQGFLFIILSAWLMLLYKELMLSVRSESIQIDYIFL